MTRGFRIALATAAVGGALALAGASPANAQVRFRGTFPASHRRVAVGFRSPFFRVGAVVPFGLRVVEDPVNGYGFFYRSRWIPVNRFGASWVVCERPAFGGRVIVAPRFDARVDGRFDRGRFTGRRFERGDRFERRPMGRRDVRGERRNGNRDRRR